MPVARVAERSRRHWRARYTTGRAPSRDGWTAAEPDAPRYIDPMRRRGPSRDSPSAAFRLSTLGLLALGLVGCARAGYDVVAPGQAQTCALDTKYGTV